MKLTKIQKRTLQFTLIATALVILIFVLFNLGNFTNGLGIEALKTQQARLQLLYDSHPVAMPLVYGLAFVAIAALCIPITMPLTLLAGALFGPLIGSALIGIGISVGATLAFLMSRHFLGHWVARRFGSQLERINQGIESDGGYFLFTLRTTPMVSYVAINLVMGLTAMSTRKFYLITQLGTLPHTYIYVNAGQQIGQLKSVHDVLSLKLLAALTLLGVFPLLAHKLLPRLVSKFKPQDLRRQNEELHNTSPSETK